MHQTAPTIDAETGAIVIREPEGLTPDNALSLKETFAPFYAAAEALREEAESLEVTDPSDKDGIKKARGLRLKLREIRVGAEKTRKAAKEASLRQGKAIDGMYNVLDYAIRPLESRLQEMEDLAERLRQAEIARIKAERGSAFAPYGTPTVDLTAMSDDEFERYLTDARELQEFRERKAKEEAERLEAERQEMERQRIEREKAEAAERARIAAENRKLREEAEKARKEREAAEAKARAEREAIEAKARKEREAREAAEAEASRLKAEQERREAAERARVEAEKKAEEERQRKAARAPDKAKMKGFAAQVRGLAVPDTKTAEGNAVAKEIAAKVESFARWIEQQAETL